MGFNQQNEPKRKLTTFLTEQKDQQSKDLNTEFPNAQAVRLQTFYRTLADQFKLPFFGHVADINASVMWSFRRGARSEAVTGMPYTAEFQKLVRSALTGEQPG